MPRWDLDQLRALAAAVDMGTFEAAAGALHVTPSAISQRIKALERHAGAVLLRRERPVRPTAAGEPLVRVARQVEALLAGAGLDHADAPGHGDDSRLPKVPLAVNGDSLTTWVLPALAPLAGDVALEVRREDQERTAALLRDGTVMGAVTSQRRAVQGCSSVVLGVMRYHAVMAPHLVERWFADGVHPRALRRAPLVVFDRDDLLQDKVLDTHGVLSADPPRHLVPASADFAEAIRLGFGWGMLPEQQSEPLEHAGGLVRLPGVDPVDVTLHWQQWTLDVPGLGVVARALAEAAHRVLRQLRAPG
ncbi:LysR family transcriptional regulator ArgP [Cellulomonas bogoriensis]|uniref:Chromosome replication initiation inhibitor protein n=1 Tax=Cellulomonas bogoriensis 69B4 = DSM 16987 TaxID=1386082 RepID=A0A0A0C1E9_9CELL|nr:LysR family transcriptional regulator ArgP [Cellulomonas bogoriensis]KGM13747.1 chromosome replication initiation inhibitor protein [Cellulomonas bogoriensis 69B4 = DSM 16987]